MKKIVQISVATATDAGHEIKRTACVDEDGHAWELHAVQGKWVKLPDLPDDKEKKS